jgi:hypothetical protein
MLSVRDGAWLAELKRSAPRASQGSLIVSTEMVYERERHTVRAMCLPLGGYREAFRAIFFC